MRVAAMFAVSTLALACSTPESSKDPSEAALTEQPATDPAPSSQPGTVTPGPTGPATPSTGCAKAATGERKGVTISVGGKQRRFDIAAPATNDAGRGHPLVFVFHGSGGSADDARSTFDFPNVARDKAIAVYPTGRDGDWDLDTETSKNPDIAFFDAMIASISESHCVDRSRVFATGYSMGAYFSNQLGCRRGDVLRAIAPHAGGGPYGGNDAYDDDGHLKCNGKPVAAMIFHGQDDGDVSIDNGESSRDHWTQANGCSAKSASTSPQPCVAFEGCKNPVVWCSIPDLGHDVWSEGTKATWDFFARF